VLYESPHRLLKLLDELTEHFGNPTVMLARELTKVYEEILIGTATELKAKLSSKKILGEFVVIVHSEQPSNDFSEDDSTQSDDNS
jgi:16S rRNA (cytidine1402-2'-O)-methyltransferase